MKKITLKALRENLAIDQKEQGLGLVKGVANPVTVRDLKFFAKQISNALQPTIDKLIADIEKEVNKYGLSLGEYDFDQDFGDEGSEDFVLLCYPDGDFVKNITMSLEWSRVSTAATYQFRSDKLEYSVRLTVNEMDPNDFDKMLNSDMTDVGDQQVENPDDGVMKEGSDEEGHHRVGVTVSDPKHTMVTKRKEQIQKIAKTKAKDKQTAIDNAIHHYKKQGYKVHDHHYISGPGEVKKESVVVQEAKEALPKWKVKVGDDHTSRTAIVPAKNAVEAKTKAVTMFKKGSHIIVGTVRAGNAAPVRESIEESADHTIEAHGVKGVKSSQWKKSFKSHDHLQTWADKNDAKVHGTRDLEKSHKESVDEAFSHKELNNHEHDPKTAGRYNIHIAHKNGETSKQPVNAKSADHAQALGKAFVNKNHKGCEFSMHRMQEDVSKRSVDIFKENDGSLTVSLAESMFNIPVECVEDFTNKFSDFVIAEQE